MKAFLTILLLGSALKVLVHWIDPSVSWPRTPKAGPAMREQMNRASEAVDRAVQRILRTRRPFSDKQTPAADGTP